MKLIDETGKRYGRLVVIEQAASVGQAGARWLCQCDCGRQSVVIGTLLRRGTTKSCGCLRSDSIQRATDAWRLPRGEGAINWLFDDGQRRARRKGVEWAIGKELFRQIIARPCVYCGAEYSSEFGDKHGFNGGVKYNGLDRVDNARGYVPDNVVPCCRACNVSKNARELEEFRDWARRLYQHWAGKDEP